MSFKNSKAERTTVTRKVDQIDAVTGNIYEALVIASKRANQINVELKEELTAKLQEFSSNTDNLEEIFENREQIEISKFFERLPKPVAMAMDELLTEKIYYRDASQEEK